MLIARSLLAQYERSRRVRYLVMRLAEKPLAQSEHMPPTERLYVRRHARCEVTFPMMLHVALVAVNCGGNASS